ncbi:hypothetical protein [Shewanella cutis]|uniref:hypothetical protein n=1 Tax=Shewanella cutis TaxID=2766780 RepID=UPI001F04D195|nr:hypothetical protein [Shewanella sp. PS-2]
MIKKSIILIGVIFLYACGTLDSKTININVGDSKEKVLGIMGVPQDRQLKDNQEAWQYCVSGAGFGYNDHKIIWFNSGQVTGITSYRSSRSGCTGAIETIRWEEAPDFILETWQR